jgi:hypothetical protein
MAAHQIAVTVDAGSIQVDPETLVMTSDDEVQWAGKNARKFSIVFDGPGPFAQRELAHAIATTSQRPRAKGRFKYSVVSQDDPSLQLDPIVIVEEPNTGTRP